MLSHKYSRCPVVKTSDTGGGYVLKQLTVDIYVIYDIYITGKLLEVIQNQINM